MPWHLTSKLSRGPALFGPVGCSVGLGCSTGEPRNQDRECEGTSYGSDERGEHEASKLTVRVLKAEKN